MRSRLVTILQRSVVACGALGAFLHATAAHAWHDEGHTYAARAAMDWLPASMPKFFTQGVGIIQHCALDPDLYRNDATPQLAAATSPDHFLDAEPLAGHAWPATRFEYFKLCATLDLDPSRNGTLPWAIAEHTQELAVAFAEHRRDPDNPAIHARCLVLAGHLAHFTADLHQPLHTTVHHDGRVQDDGPKRFKGIHRRVDALPSKMSYDEQFPLMPREPVAFPRGDQMMGFIRAHFNASHALVDRVYALESQIPPMDDPTLTDADVRELTVQRMQASAEFTAAMWMTAWAMSATLELPRWLDRSAFDADLPRVAE